ncbi:MAG TPA: RagB/SusD family nutrient uptake outer membrane protein [Chryseolinea sp.]|nr:RagB/SusD family nutrient uptake outer membrane protein [Chryseolinea sp.]
MKIIFTKKLVQAVAVLTLLSACDMNKEPYDSKSAAAALATPEDLQIATYGTYAGLVYDEYVHMHHQLGEFGGDNVALSGTSGSHWYNVYNYTHFPAMTTTTLFWSQAYKTIFSANQIIERIEDGESAALDQLKGENLFLRAMVHFDLVKFFGRPYTQGQGNNPGVVIRENTRDAILPFRSTVKEVYDFVIADLEKAAVLMTENKTASYATKHAAYALLSRIYLYMDENEKAIEYANLVINSGHYVLTPTNSYKTYFTVIPDANTETIFAIRHTLVDNKNKGSIGSQYYTDGTSGWGQMYASLDFMNLINKYPEDARHSFIEIQMASNGVDTLKRGNVPQFFVNKHVKQEGVINLSSPVMLRLAEMYLNRAEAYVKLGGGENEQRAIDDVNLIRQRAGLSGAALYTLGDLKWHESVLDVVLEERRLELAFESHRPLDLYRNNRPLVRAYLGYHSADRYNQTILPTSDRIILFIPEREIIVNPNLEQNP